jgi:hypothetical protein
VKKKEEVCCNGNIVRLYGGVLERESGTCGPFDKPSVQVTKYAVSNCTLQYQGINADIIMGLVRREGATFVSEEDTLDMIWTAVLE